MLKKIIGLFFTMSLVIGQGGIVDFLSTQPYLVLV